MIAREWKARCPKNHIDGFVSYLYETGIKDASQTIGFKGAQIFVRDINNNEITLITYWDSLQSIKAFSGDNIAVAKLYPEDGNYELDPNGFVFHYQVVENTWLNK